MEKMQLGAFLVSSRPSARFTKSFLDFDVMPRDKRHLVERPRPPLTAEGLDAVKTLKSSAATKEAVIAAARLLGQTPESATPYVDALACNFLKHPSDVKCVIAYALGQIGGEAVAPHASILVEDLEDKDPGLQVYLQQLLKASGAKGARELASKVVSGSETSAACAAQILTTMGSDGAEALASQLPHPSAAVNLRILEALLKMKQLIAQHLDKVASLLESSDVAVRKAAISSLGAAGPAAGPHASALAAFLEEDDPAVKRVALQSLGKLGEASAIHTEAVAAALLSPNPEVQTSALKALGQIGRASLNKNPLTDFEPGAWSLPDSAIVSLILHLKQKDSEMQSLTVATLKNLGGLGAAILSAQLTSSKGMRKLCCDALIQIGISDNFNEKKWQYREIHCGAAALACHLQHEDAELRVTVCEALGRCGTDARQYAILMEPVMDTDRVAEVRDAAKKSMSQMGQRKGQEAKSMFTDPRVVAHAVPAQGRRDAQKMTEIMTVQVQRIALLAASNSKARLPPRRAAAAASRGFCGCLGKASP